MKIYLDDNSAEAKLVAALRKAGHDVLVPADVGNAGISDPRHQTYAIQNDLVLLTRDFDDFEDLHELIIASGGGHPGILLVRFDNDATRDPTPRGIATALGKLVASGIPLADRVHTLNQWR